jgi:hypothetical protein
MPPKKATNKSAPDGQDAGGSLRPATGPAPSGTTPAPGEVAGDGSSAAAVGAVEGVGVWSPALPPPPPPPEASQGDGIIVIAPESTGQTSAENDIAELQDVEDDRCLKIIGPKAGRWRAGRHFGPEPTFVPIAELTLEQIDAIYGDPQLLATLESAPDGRV